MTRFELFVLVCLFLRASLDVIGGQGTTITNPSSGITLDWVAHNTIIHDLAVPGDIASGHTTITGQQMRIFGANGTVLGDVGHLVVDEATGELLKSSGKHAFDDYFINGNTAALAPLCDAIS